MSAGFEGFAEFDVTTSGTTIHGVRGGAGPPVLLLHGIPETHLMWHRVAPRLAERFTVVATDLRGFGASGTPPSTPDHAPYSMRAIALDQVEVMRALGYERFAVAGHDRGARCAYRMALDHPQAVTRLAVLDIVPTGDAFDRADRDFALGYWVWSFLAAPEPVPEQLIAAAPSILVDHMLNAWSQAPDAFPPEVRATYAAQFADPDTVHAICEEYRAAATLDHEHDRADRGRRRITCPTLALWSAAGPVAQWYEPLEVWRGWADDVRGAAIDSGHFLPEEAPDETVRHLLDFLAAAPTTP
ncbi:alpha/beta fold hydrolase [Actinomadura rudentiformis]|uniref:Alpha/beta hydrolase n=1 Tax=Actinomadura rudentiformis TaxID=359158 RepID=A0A6H9YRS9_9ACTN|nr:alpha/beta hydrolase [Actinomadura rudentiformis]KAB2343685.1 alpha/beta hydrolase [Actinomadura rudentiformis]